MEANNMAAMREALEGMLDECCNLCDVPNQMTESGHTCNWRNRWSGCQSKAVDKALAALSAPPEQPTNAAAIREACQKTIDLLMQHGNGKCRCILTWDEFNDAQKMLRAALAAPARNCDRPECATRDGAYNTWYRETWKMSRDDFPDWSVWLFATAKEKEENSNG